jgi:ParB/RepB/Spo0J family partition protein
MVATESEASGTKPRAETEAVFGENERRLAKNLPISELFLGELNERIDPGDIDGLARSIQQVGILEPLLVRPVGDRYEIIAGYRRFRAAEKAAVKTAPCVIKSLDDVSALKASFHENEERKSASPLEYGMLCWKLAQRCEDLKEVADLLGKTQSWVESRINAYELYKKANVRPMDKGAAGKSLAEQYSPSMTLGLVDATQIMQAVTSPSVRRHVARLGGDPEVQRTRMVRELSEALPKLSPGQKKKVLREFRREPAAAIGDITTRVLEEPIGIKVSISFNAEVSGRVEKELEKTGEKAESWIRRIVIDYLDSISVGGKAA